MGVLQLPLTAKVYPTAFHFHGKRSRGENGRSHDTHGLRDLRFLVFVFTLLKELCYELRGYSVITHLALKIRSSVKKTPLNQACKYRHG